LDADSVAMRVPGGLPTNGHCTVTGDELQFVTEAGEQTAVEAPTVRLGHFFDGEVCLRPTDDVDDRGRTLWRTFEVAKSLHLGQRQ
jgi:hypothetical protein